MSSGWDTKNGGDAAPGIQLTNKPASVAVKSYPMDLFAEAQDLVTTAQNVDTRSYIAERDLESIARLHERIAYIQRELKDVLQILSDFDSETRTVVSSFAEQHGQQYKDETGYER